MGDAIKYLYEKFILRDVLSFVMPGAIVILTTIFLFYPDLLKRYLPWPLYIPLFGLFFMTGFAAQCLGEIFDIVRFTPRDRGTWGQRFRILGCNWADDRNIWWMEAHKRLVNFREETEREEKEWARQQLERMVILKQMCANSSLAIALAGILFLIHGVLSSWYSMIVLVPLPVSLFWGYRIHVLREDTINRAVRHEL